jgi:hypothetical protein
MTAKTEVEHLRAELVRLAAEHNAMKAELAAFQAILSALLAAQRLDPHSGEQRLQTLREMALSALPLPEKDEPHIEEERQMLASFSEIFDGVEFAVRAIKVGPKN